MNETMVENDEGDIARTDSVIKDKVILVNLISYSLSYHEASTVR